MLSATLFIFLGSTNYLISQSGTFALPAIMGRDGVPRSLLPSFENRKIKGRVREKHQKTSGKVGNLEKYGKLHEYNERSVQKV